MPHKSIYIGEIFDVWCIDFMRPFLVSYRNMYILLTVYYVFKSVEAIACLKNDAMTMIGFVHKNIISRFGALRMIVSDEGTHFINKVLTKMLSIEI